MAVDLQMASASEALTKQDGRLVDLVDGLLNHGVVLRGGLWLTVADVDLVFLGVDVVLSTPQKMRELNR
ncbi:gas vesicle protein GvpJ [Sulfitobacter sp. JB4-11]|uniref:gas vesicle protein GvpJ n=1 Tax=Sulfitobacter rhodophyticola TaxID=3238304 RepID=UPI003516B609